MKHSYWEMDGSLLRPSIVRIYSNKYSILADEKLQRWRYCTLIGHRNGSARSPLLPASRSDDKKSSGPRFDVAWKASVNF
jgi:hypothetical protein